MTLTENGTRTRLPRWIRRYGWVVLGIAAVAHVVTVVIWPHAFFYLVDLSVYRDGVLTMFSDRPLYEHGVSGVMNFVYPPFAALLFAPMGLFPTVALRVIWTVANIVLLAAVIRWCWLRMGGTQPLRAQLPVIALLVGVTFWVDAIRITFILGQINIVLLALVAWDVLRNDGRRWQGVGIGIAAAIKLTPLLFIGYLLVTRRFRAAAVAFGTFVAAAVVGFVFLPADSVSFWLRGTFGEIGRINPIDSGSNHSIRGLFARTLGIGHGDTVAWALCAVLAVAAVAYLARRAHRTGDEVLGLALCGLAASAISPFSWTHHWVWLAPLITYLAYAGVMRRDRLSGVLALVMTALALGYLTDTRDPSTWFIPPSSIVTLDVRFEGLPRFVFGNFYVLLFTALLFIGHVLIRRREADAAVSLSQPVRG